MTSTITNICQFYSTVGCSIGDKCGFLHIKQNMKEYIDDNSHICVPFIFGNCKNRKCVFIHMDSDIRYGEYKKKLDAFNENVKKSQYKKDTYLNTIQILNNKIKELEEEQVFITDYNIQLKDENSLLLGKNSILEEKIKKK